MRTRTAAWGWLAIVAIVTGCSSAQQPRVDTKGCMDPRAKLDATGTLCYTCLPYEELVVSGARKSEPFACQAKDCAKNGGKCATRGAVLRKAVWVKVSTEDESLELRSDEKFASVRGKSVATVAGCLDCHTTDGSDGKAPSWKGLYGSLRWMTDGTAIRANETYLRESVLRPDLRKAKQVSRVYRDSMPIDMGSRLTDDELDDLLAYIKSLK